jgi:hypothetical protein
VDNSYLIQVALELLQENFTGTGTVEYDEEMKAFKVMPTDPNFILEVVAIMEGELDIANWNGVVDGVAGVSASLSELLGVGEGYQVLIVNPANPDRYLLQVTDGIVLFDALNQ